MKSLIRKILKESTNISPNAPHWVSDFHKMSREEKIVQIEKNKKNIEKLLPTIKNLFVKKFGDDLVKLTVKEKNAHYGYEIYTTNKIVLSFYFSNEAPNVNSLRREVFNDLVSFFDIDVTYYGTPLDLEFYKAVWERF
jgi:hypothetical protein